MTIRILRCILAATLVMACQDDLSETGKPPGNSVKAITTAAEAIAAANAELAEQGFTLEARTITSAIDMGDRWRLLYELPEGSTGGPLIVVVNKQSRKIVHLETEQ